MPFIPNIFSKNSRSKVKNLLFGERAEILPYSGERPFSAEQVGYGEGELKSLAGAYLPELKRRAMGEGLVGFDPSHRATLRSEFLKDFGDYESDVYSKASQQSSGQGLRGGVPLSIRGELTKDLGRARESGLAGIDIEDLEARRADINSAFYQQPEEITRGAGIQKNRADFDLSEYEGRPIEETPGLIGPLLSLAGTAAGAYFGGPAGARAGGQVGSTLGQAYQNRRSSYGNNSLNSVSPSEMDQFLAQQRAVGRRY